MDDTARGNAARVRDFLHALKFEAQVDSGGSVFMRTSKVTASMRYAIRFEDEQSAPSGAVLPSYFSFFASAAPAGVPSRGVIIITESLRRIAARYGELKRYAGSRGVAVLSLAEFFWSFVDTELLERNCRASLTTLPRTAYVRPTISVAGTLVDVDTFIEDTILSRATPRLVIVHAPGGRGKTAFSEYLTAAIFERARNQSSPLPFLLKFSNFQGIFNADALLQEAIKLYELELDLTVEALRLLVRYGLFVIVLDGYDEMSERAGERLSLRNIGSLAQAIHKSSEGHAILTCRSTFLASHPAMVDELVKQSEQTLLLAEISQFTNDQITRYLEWNTPSGLAAQRHRDRVRTYISQQKQIGELAREPLLLGMISEVVGRGPGRLPGDVGEVYGEFVEQVCDREIIRHDLPSDLPQRRFLASLASLMVEAGEYTVGPDWVRLVIEEELEGYWREKSVDAAEREEMVEKLLDHYMFSPVAVSSNAELQFRHTTFRDFLAAWKLRESLGEESQFVEMLSQRELPDDVVMFLVELLTPGFLEVLRRVGPGLSAVAFRNMVRMLVRWDGGIYFQEVLPPPASLRNRVLDRLAFDSLDLRDYEWEGSSIEGAVFWNCDLTGADLSRASWREVRLERCTLQDAYIGEDDAGVRVVIDGGEVRGADLRHALTERGARGFGAVAEPVSEVSVDPMRDLLREMFSKVVEGNRPENTRVVNKKMNSFERGRMCARFVPLVRNHVVPLLLRRGYLEPTLDRHGTLRLASSRLREVIDFLFRDHVSDAIDEVLAQMRSFGAGV